MAGVRGEERGTGTEREAWVAGFFLIDSSQRGEDRSQNIHAPAICPPPPSSLSKARVEGGKGQPACWPMDQEGENGGVGVTSQVERGRGGATPATAETAVVRKTFRRVDGVIPT